MCNILKVNNKDNTNAIVVVFLLITLTVFHIFSSVSTLDFEQVDICWADVDFHGKSFLLLGKWLFKVNNKEIRTMLIVFVVAFEHVFA